MIELMAYLYSVNVTFTYEGGRVHLLGHEMTVTELGEDRFMIGVGVTVFDSDDVHTTIEWIDIYLRRELRRQSRRDEWNHIKKE